MNRTAATKGYKAAIVDMHQTLPRPNRLQPTESVSEMNRRSRALAATLANYLGESK